MNNSTRKIAALLKGLCLSALIGDHLYLSGKARQMGLSYVTAKVRI